MDKLYYMGIDVGSTTVKLYVEDQEHQCIYSKYQRHYSDVKPAIESLIKEVQEHYGNLPVKGRIRSRSDCLYKDGRNIYS